MLRAALLPALIASQLSGADVTPHFLLPPLYAPVDSIQQTSDEEQQQRHLMDLVSDYRHHRRISVQNAIEELAPWGADALLENNGINSLPLAQQILEQASTETLQNHLTRAAVFNSVHYMPDDEREILERLISGGILYRRKLLKGYHMPSDLYRSLYELAQALPGSTAHRSETLKYLDSMHRKHHGHSLHHSLHIREQFPPLA